MCWTIICCIFALSRAMWTIIRWIFALPTSLVPHIFYKFLDDIVGWMAAHVMDAFQNPRQVNNGQIILARDLEIRKDRDNIYKWLVLEKDPRFNEALEALHVMELRIRARLNLSQLLPNEKYSVHLIFKTTPNARGLDTFQEAILYDYDNPIPKDVCLERTTNTPKVGYIGFPVERNGWMELELGAFLRKPDHILGEVVVCLQETNVKDAKTGLIIAAIEVHPS